MIQTWGILDLYSHTWPLQCLHICERHTSVCVYVCMWMCMPLSTSFVSHILPIEQEAHPWCKSGMSASLSTQILGSPVVVEWSSANNNSCGVSSVSLSLYTPSAAAWISLLGFIFIHSDKWVDREESLYCIKFGIAITLQFPDRMFSLLHLALINSMVC